MKTFKELVQQDIHNVFVNQNEFSEKVMINGEEMNVVFDDDEINPADMNKKVAIYDVLFHVASVDFKYIPLPGKMMDFNGEEYFIKRVSDNMGILTIGLSRNES